MTLLRPYYDPIMHDLSDMLTEGCVCLTSRSSKTATATYAVAVGDKLPDFPFSSMTAAFIVAAAPRVRPSLTRRSALCTPPPLPCHLPSAPCRSRVPRMCAAPRAPPSQFVSAELGCAAQAAAFAHAGGDISAVARRCAAGVAEAVGETYSVRENTGVFVCCGPGFNGLVGMHAALLLKERGYEPAVFRLPGGLDVGDDEGMRMLEEAGVSTCDFVPATIDFYFDVAVDALFGLGFDGGDVRQEYWDVFGMLVTTDLPIISVDMPSGWDVEDGPRKVDVPEASFLRPEVLVSLAVPKNGAKVFCGAFHYIGGRGLLPPGWAGENNLQLPAFRGEEAECALLASSGFPSRNSVGEAYGSPGRFEATLWNPNPRRKWVSDDDVEDMEVNEWE